MNIHRLLGALAVTAALAPATFFTVNASELDRAEPTIGAAAQTGAFETDRRAILAMAGDYSVQFDFIETVALATDYAIKDRKKSGGDEIVRVLEDRGDFISLQHTLVIPGSTPFAIKHWRQDWIYEPEHVSEFVGANAWKRRALSKAERKGKWAQVVYQVDDGPRYAGVAAWRHEYGISSWAGKSWRPLPRRDATTREDYHAIEAVNRHVITPAGWMHEQDNTKLVLSGSAPKALVREVGVNTYLRSADFDIGVGDRYWQKTAAFWAIVREKWKTIAEENETFALTIQGEPQELYDPLLALAGDVETGERKATDAGAEAERLIDSYVNTRPTSLARRLKERRSGEVRTAEQTNE